MLKFNKSKTVLILSFTDQRRDPRVYRQIEALKNDFQLSTAGVCPYTQQKTKHFILARQKNTFISKAIIAILLKTRKFEENYWNQPLIQQAHKLLKPHRFDVIVANDLETLPLVLMLAKDKNTKVYIDAHEYAPKQFEGDLVFRFFFTDYNDYLCRTYLPHADYMTAVCDGIADEYSNNYQVDCDVLMNMPTFVELKPSNVDDKNIRIIHHGCISKSRKLENMIRLAGEYLTSRFHLDLMLINNNPAYLKRLREIAKPFPNVHFIEPVEMPKIAEAINQYDLGLYMLPPISFNNHFTLPNKFFEFIQARLTIAIWPSPEMKNITVENKLGVVADDFSIDSMADKLNNLDTNDIKLYKANAGKAALRYNSEKSAEQLRKIIWQLVK